MFTLDDIKDFLEDLKLPINDENIKWGYEMLIKEIKTMIKIRKFEKKYNEDFFADDCCCGDDCKCGDNCDCTDGCSCGCSTSKSKAKK